MSLIDTDSKSTVVYDELQLHNNTDQSQTILDSLSPSSTDAE